MENQQFRGNEAADKEESDHLTNRAWPVSQSSSEDTKLEPGKAPCSAHPAFKMEALSPAEGISTVLP